jgi:hypothetical protein
MDIQSLHDTINKLKSEKMKLEERVREYEDIIIFQKDAFIFIFIFTIIGQVIYLNTIGC